MAGVAPGDITFELVPRGNFGLRANEGSTAEEGNLVQLSDGSYYGVFRTVSGFLGRAVSTQAICRCLWFMAHFEWLLL